MRRLNRFSVLAVTVSLVMLFAGSMVSEAYAYHGKGKSPMGRLLKGLNLTAEQKQQVKAIVKGHRNDLISGRVAVLQARQNLIKVTTGNTFDQNAVQTAYNALASAQSNMTVLRAKIFSEIVPILTPEQQTTLQGKIAKKVLRMQKAIERLQAKLNAPPQNNP